MLVHTAVPSCYSIVPEDFKRIVQYIDGLKYADEPDYIYLRNSLAAIAKEARVDFNKPLDWIGITSKKRDKPKSGVSYSYLQDSLLARIKLYIL
ncbi:hypothetical protein COOONC_10087 [Cooperia oncophora]